MNAKRFLIVTIVASATTSVAVILVALSIAFAARHQITAFFASPASSPIEMLSGESAVEAAVSKANPAVVSIIITKDVPIIERYNVSPQDDLLNDLFGLPLVPEYRQNGTRKTQVGGGSGFLVSADGLIVTNKHVVDDPAAEYTVYTNDGKKHPAKVAALDPLQDIAFLRISPQSIGSFPYLTFSDSENLRLGETVIAIGNALGEFRNTVSVGVVSGLARSIVAGDITGAAIEELDQVIQTDAAINPGNSGGPLLDLDGNVVGVNVAIAAGSQNIGFALPSNVVSAAVESVKEKGIVVRPYLGVRYIPITESLKEEMKLSVDYGVLVVGEDRGQAIIPGSPAAKAGIVEGDIILEFNGTKINPDATLSSLIAAKKVGDTVDLKIISQGNEKTIKVLLEAYSVK